MSSLRLLQLTENDRIVTIRPTRPIAPGPETEILALEVLDVCAELDARLEPLCGVVLACSSEGFFLRAPKNADDYDAVTSMWAHATRAVGRLQQPTIAVLASDAIGPAWELALACDLRLADATVRVGTPDVQWGRLPQAGGTQRLARLAGIPTALELLLLGRILSAPEALEHRLLYRVGPVESILQDMEQALRSSAPIAVNFAKEAVHGSTEVAFDVGMRFEADLAALLLTTSDRAEGIGAFLSRRGAHFEGH